MFYIHHKIRTRKTVDYGDITVYDICALKKQRTIESIRESKKEALTIDLEDVLKTYESLIQYLRGMQGGSGVPFIYVVRESNELHPKPSIDDPVAIYETHDEDMVKRAPILEELNPQGTEEDAPFDNSFIADRGEIWYFISPLIIKKETWTHIKRTRMSRDGRKAMLAFRDQFLGPNNVDHIQKQAGKKLLSLSYQSERKNWNFERFVIAQKEGLTDHRYCGMDVRTKVNRLLDGIQTESLDTVKAKIFQDRELNRDFER